MKKFVNIAIFLLLGTFLTQGFQCASREMTTAKVKLKSKQYSAAAEALRSELIKNPSNDEAKITLAEVYKLLGEDKVLIKYLKSMNGTLTNPIYVEKLQALSYNLWIDYYEKANQFYKRYSNDNTQTNNLDSAIKYMTFVTDVMPEMANPYYYIGEYNRLNKNETKKIELYKTYLKVIEKDIALAQEKGFYLGLTRDEFIKNNGKPISTTKKKLNKADSNAVDIFKIDGKTVYLLSLKHSKSKKSKNAKYKISGWRVDPPTYWHNSEKSLLMDILKDPFVNLMQEYYDKEDYETSLIYTKLMLSINPNDANVNTALIELYKKLNKIDVAITELKASISKNSKNKFAWDQLGDIYRVKENYSKAIDAYSKALEIDPNYASSIVDLATSYKNKAGTIQKVEVDKYNSDEKYEIKKESYEPFLKKSAKYYKKALKTKKFRGNHKVLIELLDIYIVLDDKNEIEKLVLVLEKKEAKLKDEDKQAYYLKMLNVYGKLKNTEKIKYIENKLSE